MVTTVAESMHLIRILLRYISKKTAYKILNDMEIEVAKTTENISLRDSIEMAKECFNMNDNRCYICEKICKESYCSDECYEVGEGVSAKIDGLQ
ncbi:MAG: hypothetical protein QF704_07680 [Anaerolineales bacterium]|jgi:hypothetical protein|nr:hypothetical protein [Anaerolineales bacterium]|tara:strand:+ start:772 stop:1053 length:282 start_codon:yes stop_codon:yes gene_type:complete